ncbi:dihydroneopterin aldolase [Taylorella equigenitalis]|uniref:FolB protein n=2 Tax=Taylorella equigenitalis TaxID=29575 RepID=I7IB68_9BURK|nr:dihydroneopterin aldolase [Taylorella equigenitalis]KGK33341.1 dihydroneopterin aldolase [Taylorella equigenitalis]KOS58648.1 dihydroneopterin aldolase [Taylorella equigenitalis]WFD78703.1 dihydroneopterin aldolase [Taylorella equigenitalis]WFD80181.1 dihydroneopterin aldolase [Taylorella equigenitalis]WFD81658.1 dihydroneopterin aldolase [Taylorella equigenitalis]
MSQMKIFFNKLKIDAKIGILEHELRATQIIEVDVVLDILTPSAVDDKNIKTVLDYRKIRDIIREESVRQHVHLVETLLLTISARLYKEFDVIEAIDLKIGKPAAFSDSDAVGVQLISTRSDF